MALDWYKWYPARYRADTMHLTPFQDGCYRRLIDHYMETECALPASLTALARIVGIGQTEMESVWPVLSDFFVVAQDGLYHNKKCDAQLESNIYTSKRKKVGAEARWSKNGKKENAAPKTPSAEPPPDANAVQMQCNDDANAMQMHMQDKIREDRDIDTNVSISPPISPSHEISTTDEGQKNGNGRRLPAKPKDAGRTLIEWLKAYGPDGGAMPTAWADYAEQRFGWAPDVIQFVAERFWRYWTGPDASGGGRKKDWERTWKNWCDTDLPNAQAFIRARKGDSLGQKPSYTSAVVDSSEKALQMLGTQSGEAQDIYPEDNRTRPDR